MKGKHKHETQLNMFKVQLMTMISEGNQLVVLSHHIDLEAIAKKFEQYYSIKERPNEPMRIMVGKLMLKVCLAKQMNSYS